MRCTVFSESNPLKPCGVFAERFLPTGINTSVATLEDAGALIMGYIPLCMHHSEMIPSRVRLLKLEEIYVNG